MSGFAVRKDGLGFRAVESADDLTTNEEFNAAEPEMALAQLSAIADENRALTHGNLITGSAPLYAEYARLVAMQAPVSEIAKALAAANARFAEIDKEFPRS